MPRIYTSESDPIDFCRQCFPDEDVARKKYGHLGDGPDNRGDCFGFDDDHPDYGDTKDYRCYSCKKLLTERDN